MQKNKDNLQNIRNLSSMYENWFLEYASYVILERAIPKIEDGLKPVQRRLLYSLYKMHDKRYHKVANVIGNTMQYHPHGDQAIGDALVALGQKELLIDTQGNWGDVRTGDRAAAPRYIESRLTPFALEIAFNNDITAFQPSYDGRNNEPTSLPVKFPLLLSQGTEGIAVGLSTKILPHNFKEIIKASIYHLKDKPFTLYPDFITKGMIDISNYNNGKKGGKVRIRSNIEIIDKQTLKIVDLPYNITTTNLIDSIVKANNSGKIKIKSIEDNTAQHVEIIINLIKGISPNVTIDALYAFTNCEISVSPNCCVIIDNKPNFISINDLLRKSTDNTVVILKRELEFTLNKMNEKWHQYNLEKIFIEEKIYRKIENCSNWESVIQVIKKSLNPFQKLFIKDITNEDIIKLTEIKIKRISKYDIDNQINKIIKIENDIEEVKNNLKNLIDYTIRYFNHILVKYGENHNRNTKIEKFDSISARRVVVANEKLYINKENGFIGTSLKNDIFISKCSSIDNAIVFLENGKYLVTSVSDKKYIGKNIIHAAVWKKNDKHMIYNTVYKDGKTKINFVKRFSVTSIVKDKVYNLTQGNDLSKIIYFTANPNSESEVVTIYLNSRSKAKNKKFLYDFSDINIKGRNSKGNILSKYSIRKIEQKNLGDSTLGGREIWIDKNIGKLNSEKRGDFLGTFNADDKILVVYNDGSYEMTTFDFSNRYKITDINYINKYNENIVYTILHKCGETKRYYIKRFKINHTQIAKRLSMILSSRSSKMIFFSDFQNSSILYNYRLKNGEKKTKEIITTNVVNVKSWTARGNLLDNKKRMNGFKITKLDDTTNVESLYEENKNENDNLTLF